MSKPKRPATLTEDTLNLIWRVQARNFGPITIGLAKKLHPTYQLMFELERQDEEARKRRVPVGSSKRKLDLPPPQ